MKMLDGNTAALKEYERKQEALEYELKVFKTTEHYNQLIEEEFKRTLLNENIFWEAIGPDGHCGSAGAAVHAELVELIVNKDDAALGKEIRMWIEHYVRESVQEEVEERGIEHID